MLKFEYIAQVIAHALYGWATSPASQIFLKGLLKKL